MKRDRSLIRVLKVLPKLLAMEQARGWLMTTLKQWGIRNVVPIFFKTIKQTGFASTLSDILRFRLDRIFACFYPCGMCLEIGKQ